MLQNQKEQNGSSWNSYFSFLNMQYSSTSLDVLPCSALLPLPPALKWPFKGFDKSVAKVSDFTGTSISAFSERLLFKPSKEIHLCES